MGFNGYKRDGTPKWDLVSNVDVVGVEVRNVCFDALCLCLYCTVFAIYPQD